jgi:hypothetical protein
VQKGAPSMSRMGQSDVSGEGLKGLVSELFIAMFLRKY